MCWLIVKQKSQQRIYSFRAVGQKKNAQSACHACDHELVMFASEQRGRWCLNEFQLNVRTIRVRGAFLVSIFFFFFKQNIASESI